MILSWHDEYVNILYRKTYKKCVFQNIITNHKRAENAGVDSLYAFISSFVFGLFFCYYLVNLLISKNEIRATAALTAVTTIPTASSTA